MDLKNVKSNITDSINTLKENFSKVIEEVKQKADDISSSVLGDDSRVNISSVQSPKEELSVFKLNETDETGDNVSFSSKNETIKQDENTNLKSGIDLAFEFSEIARNNSGLTSVNKMQNLVDENINSNNIIEFLNYYKSVFKEDSDSSILDTVTSEVLATKDERKKLLGSIMDKLIECAQINGVSEDDIKKTKNNFNQSMNQEFDTWFKFVNPEDMEKSIEELKTLIINKNPNLDMENLDPKDGLESDVELIVKDNRGLYSVLQLEEKYQSINNEINGNRLDSSIEDWAVKIGDKEVKILTDNNIVSEEWAKNNGKISQGGIITNEIQQAMAEALENAAAHGQILPEKIYLTNLFDDSTTSGVFSLMSDKNAIFINANQLNNTEYFKHIIYHETSHLNDFKKRNRGYLSLSEEKNVDISPIDKESKNDIIHFDGDEIEKNDVSAIISEYALTSPGEFAAEVAAMITEGKIVLDDDGEYKMNIDSEGFYVNALGNKVFVQPPDISPIIVNDEFLENTNCNIVYGDKQIFEEKLNKIMKLYNYLTDGKITNPNILE